MLVLVSATRIRPLLIRQICYSVSNTHANSTPLKLGTGTNWCRVCYSSVCITHSRCIRSLVPPATSPQRKRHGYTKDYACRFHQTEKGTQPGIHRTWRGDCTSGLSFQEVASGGERVDSATLFTVVAIIGKKGQMMSTLKIRSMSHTYCLREWEARWWCQCLVCWSR